MARQPLVGWLLADGLVSPEPRGTGLRAGRHFEAIGADGEHSPGLWIAGPPVRGSRFEATAVPELRGIAEQVATAVLRSAVPEVRLA